jgi:hypothetical protein
MVIQGQVGPISANQSLGAGVNAPLRQTNTGDLAFSEVHGRYYEQVYRSNVYSGGTTIAALSANTITLTNTSTPILGVWNPSTSNVNLVLLIANLVCVSNNLTSGAGPGVFVWASSAGNGAISTGNAPWNRKTLAAAGSQAKYFKLSAPDALTGLTNNVVIGGGLPMISPSGMVYTTIASTGLMQGYAMNWDIGGSIIVPPGGVFDILNTTSSTTFSCAGELIWEEVPV